jgi:hypothetical protein
MHQQWRECINNSGRNASARGMHHTGYNEGNASAKGMHQRGECMNKREECMTRHTTRGMHQRGECINEGNASHGIQWYCRGGESATIVARMHHRSATVTTNDALQRHEPVEVPGHGSEVLSRIPPHRPLERTQIGLYICKSPLSNAWQL